MAQDHFNKSELIEIAKGKYELPTNWNGFKNKIIRIWKTK
jgi:hypothetical protein